MKTFKYIIASLVALPLFSACSADKFDGADLSNIPAASDYADMITYSVDQNTNTATFVFEETDGIIPVWVVDGSEYNTGFTFTKYWRKKGDYTVKCYVKNRNGMSDGSLDYTVNIEKTKMNGFAGFDVESDDNLFKNVDVANNWTTWFADGGWNELAQQPTLNKVNGEYRLHFDEVGPDRWQGQLAFNHIPVNIEAGKKYDFSVIVTSNKKLPGMKIKICNGADGSSDSPVLMDEDFEVLADEPICLYGSLLEGFASNKDLKFVFDFGGSESPADVIMENFVLVDHDKNPIVAPEKTVAVNWCAVDSPDNLGAGFNTVGSMAFWWANADWQQVGDPTFSYSDGVYTIVATENGGAEWQGQSSINNVKIDMQEGLYYDIKCKVVSSAAVGRYTLKVCQQNDDDNFLLAKGDLKLNEGENIVQFTKLEMKKGAASEMKWIFDFGGTPVGTEIKLSDFILQKHNPK